MISITHFNLVLVSAALLAPCCASAQIAAEPGPAVAQRFGGADAVPTLSSVQYVLSASEDGAREVALADIALGKSPSQDVRRLAAQIRDDYGDANAELVQIAVGMGVSPPKGNDSSDVEIIKTLNGKDGAEFDLAYLTAVVSAHAHAISLCNAGMKGHSTAAAAFATRRLQVLQNRWQLADALLAKVRSAAADLH